MKYLIAMSVLLVACSQAYPHALGRGPGGSPAGVSGKSSASGSQGGHYAVGDEFQPWPQAEMQQYAKPKFETYKREQK
jgi:hypothetical protein